ncbi:hypothetical protein ON010_g11214 [Phytophthora cinnamomi]|nr:hypothetical protein ON010_g11214 [Phytophthora cinnamomi]
MDVTNALSSLVRVLLDLPDQLGHDCTDEKQQQHNNDEVDHREEHDVVEELVEVELLRGREIVQRERLHGSAGVEREDYHGQEAQDHHLLEDAVHDLAELRALDGGANIVDKPIYADRHGDDHCQQEYGRSKIFVQALGVAHAQERRRVVALSSSGSSSPRSSGDAAETTDVLPSRPSILKSSAAEQRGGLDRQARASRASSPPPGSGKRVDSHWKLVGALSASSSIRRSPLACALRVQIESGVADDISTALRQADHRSAKKA